MDFTKHIFTTSNGLAFYGPENSFALDLTLADAWWAYEDGIKYLIAGVLPSVTAPTTYKARHKLAKAQEEYTRRGSYKKASPLIQQRFAINFHNGLSVPMTARSELISSSLS
jgi:hypothetical protein